MGDRPNWFSLGEDSRNLLLYHFDDVAPLPFDFLLKTARLSVNVATLEIRFPLLPWACCLLKCFVLLIVVGSLQDEGQPEV